MSQDNLNIRLDQDLTNQMTVNKNLSQEIIVTNTDKVTIILNDHHQIVKKKMEWLNPLGIFLSVLTTLLTANFDKTAFGVSPEIWKAIFIVSCLCTFFYSVYLIFIAIKYFNRGTVSEFITKLKNQSPSITTNVLSSVSFIQGIEIFSARYGAKDKFIDLTEKISEMISQNITEFKATNELGGDPIPGEGKTLEIHCNINGTNKKFSVAEGAIVKLH